MSHSTSIPREVKIPKLAELTEVMDNSGTNTDTDAEEDWDSKDDVNLDALLQDVDRSCTNTLELKQSSCEYNVREQGCFAEMSYKNLRSYRMDCQRMSWPKRQSKGSHKILYSTLHFKRGTSPQKRWQSQAARKERSIITKN